MVLYIAFNVTSLLPLDFFNLRELVLVVFAELLRLRDHWKAEFEWSLGIGRRVWGYELEIYVLLALLVHQLVIQAAKAIKLKWTALAAFLPIARACVIQMRFKLYWSLNLSSSRRQIATFTATDRFKWILKRGDRAEWIFVFGLIHIIGSYLSSCVKVERSPCRVSFKLLRAHQVLLFKSLSPHDGLVIFGPDLVSARCWWTLLEFSGLRLPRWQLFGL